MNKTQEKYFILKIEKEMANYEDELLSFSKKSIFNNAKEIFIRNLIFIYLSANAENYSLSKLPKQNILETLQERIENYEFELSEDGVGEMLTDFEEREEML